MGACRVSMIGNAKVDEANAGDAAVMQFAMPRLESCDASNVQRSNVARLLDNRVDVAGSLAASYSSTRSVASRRENLKFEGSCLVGL